MTVDQTYQRQVTKRKNPSPVSTLLGLLALALLPVVPMPSAGGTPISVVLMFVLIASQVIGKRETRLDGTDLLLLGISVALLGLELITVIATSTTADMQFALARIYWITLLLVTLFFTNAEFSRGNTNFIFNALSLGLIILLMAMIAQSLFYPEYDAGRDFGVIQMPIPRATGVPNSDGKIGTFLAVCLSVALFYGKRLQKRNRIILTVGPFAGLLFTQSRSGLLAFLVILVLYWVYRCFSEHNSFALVGRWVLAICAVVLLFYYMGAILQNLVGQGTLEQNVLSRGRLDSYAFDLITKAPFFGLGAEHVDANGTQFFIHNTVLAMSVKSGVLAGFLMTLTLIYPALAFPGDARFTFFKIALVAGLVVEHSLYPGFINEFIIIGYVVTKCVWHLSFAVPAHQGRNLTRGAGGPIPASGAVTAVHSIAE